MQTGVAQRHPGTLEPRYCGFPRFVGMRRMQCLAIELLIDDNA